MNDRRRRPVPESTVVYLEMTAPVRHDPSAWDDLMAATVRRLRGELRRSDSVGRYDTGILTLLSGVRADLGERVAQRILGALEAEPVQVSRGEFRLSADPVLAELEPGGRIDEAVARARGSGPAG
jgi:PleD family two-component response regulator